MQPSLTLVVGKTYGLVSDKDAIAKVIAEVSGCDSPKRYWVEIRNYRKTHGEFVTQSFSDGKNVGYYTAYDLMELPFLQPPKKDSWVYLLIDSQGNMNTTSREVKLDYNDFSGELIGRKKITLVEGEFDE